MNNLTITRPALRYYGSKWSLAQWIWSYMPPHEHRVILFAGSLSDTLRWPVPKLETAVDLDGRVVNFFRVLRERPEELVRAIKLTPWHQAEYDLSHETAVDQLEDARRFWVTCWMSVQGGPMPGNSGFRWMKDFSGRYLNVAGDGIKIGHLYAVAERLKSTQFLQTDALETAAKFKNEPNALIYADPPYVLGDTKRTTTTGYTYDTSTQLHTDLFNILNESDGTAVVCGYQSELYRDLYEAHGWHRVDREARTNSGSSKTESLWISPRTWSRLHSDFSHLPIFDYQVTA